MTTILSDSQLPTDRDGQALWLLEQEARIADLCRAAMRRIVLTAFERFAGSLTAAGDLNELETIEQAWLTFVNNELVDELGAVHLSGAMTAWVGVKGNLSDEFAAQWAAVVNHNAESYMRQHLPKLVNVGTRTKQIVRRMAEQAISKGYTNEELKAQIEKLSQFSEARADTVARTETIGAYVQGDLAGARALGDDGPVEKVWVATLDARTRETHASAHDQVRKMADTFQVGGVSMDGPHDPNAPPGEVVNCRCYVEMLYPGDRRPDGSTVEGEQAAAGPVETSTVVSKPVTIPAPPTKAEMLRQGSPQEATAAALNAGQTFVSEDLTEGVKRWTAGIDDSVRKAIGDYYRTGALPVGRPDLQALIDTVQAAPRTQTPLMRGFRLRSVGYGDENAQAFADALVPGAEIDMPMSSWTSKQGIAEQFAHGPAGKSVVMRVNTDAKALRIERVASNVYPDQGEWIMEDKLRVVSRTTDAKGRIIIDLEVVQ